MVYNDIQEVCGRSRLVTTRVPGFARGCRGLLGFARGSVGINCYIYSVRLMVTYITAKCRYVVVSRGLCAI